MPHGVCVLGCCHTGVSSLGKGTSLKIHTFGIATVAALLISQLSAPLPPNNTATSSYKLDQATFTLNQAGSNLTFEIGDGDPLAIDRILVNGTELKSDAQGNYLVNNQEQRSAF